MKVSKSALKLVAGCIAALGLAAPSFAQSYSTNLQTDVSVTLTPKCYFNGATPTMTFSQTYTAFQAAAVTASQTAAVSCTRGATTPGYVFAATNASIPGSGYTTGTTATVYSSNVAGLGYTLTATPSAVSAGTAASGGTGALPGTGTVQVDLSIGGSQAGDTGAATTDTAYLYVKF